jgi:hypothetical protein
MIMNQISKEALDFVSEAKEQFSSNENLATYRNQESEFIALRGGTFEDCIMVYELGSSIGNFTQQLPRQHTVLVDYDELEKYKKLKESVVVQVGNVQGAVDSNGYMQYSDYNSGYLKALEEVLSLLD